MNINVHIYIYTYYISYDGDDMFVLSGLVDPADSPSSSKFSRICFLEVSISMIVWVVILRHLQLSYPAKSDFFTATWHSHNRNFLVVGGVGDPTTTLKQSWRPMHLRWMGILQYQPSDNSPQRGGSHCTCRISYRISCFFKC